jgi:UDP-N-acetylglucosamine--N-acetylmuramyl-(pentapeptide) pyrophosphoryl-undecaprenol N-acetylglucosamine transferase
MLIPQALQLLQDNARQQTLSENISKLALPNADEVIAQHVLELVNGK